MMNHFVYPDSADKGAVAKAASNMELYLTILTEIGEEVAASDDKLKVEHCVSVLDYVLRVNPQVLTGRLPGLGR